ncbi:hypothetical protein [Armatimonas sp.]|uniref:hypothetical protein n=1 Tax=Armatimonas sp. TaxID=1872638 RepID=UPI00375325EF
MIFPNHFTQTQRATATLETMAMNLENAAEAIRATLAGNAQDYHLNTIGEHMTSDSYGLSFSGFGEVRCPSCGVIDWTRGQGDTQEGFCPKCATHRNENKFCSSCERWFPNAEFEHPFYCEASQGTESETSEICRECLREQNEADGDNPQY